MGERGFRIKTDINKEGWEEAEFPVVCETCLGDNPYVRMTKERFGKSCKICERPYTAFRWRPGTGARFKSTQLCQTCSKLKNVCQVCVLDLQYGLPVEVRDKYLAVEDQVVVPESDANREWFAGQHNAMVEAGGAGGYGAAPRNQTLLRLARNKPYYRRNLPHKCSFYAKGECTRGDRCPFLHEMPTDPNDPLANQNTRDRYYGKDDPVAAKLLKRIDEMPALRTPEDPSVKSLYVGRLPMDGSVTQDDLKDVFYQFGELESIRVVPRQSCAFVEYTLRDAAERAAQTMYNCLYVKGHRLQLSWASRRKEDALGGAAGGGGPMLAGAPGAPAMPAPAAEAPAVAETDDNRALQAAAAAVAAPAAPAPLPPAPAYIPPPPGLRGAPLLAPRGPGAPPPGPPPRAPGPPLPGRGGGYHSMYPSMNPQRMGATPTVPPAQGQSS